MKIIYITFTVCAALIPAIATKPDDCIVTIDFSKAPNGTSLKGGMYLEREWYNEYGLTLSASGGLSNKPRLFDSSHPGTKKFGDPDLGSPNKRCPGGGPGIGRGGVPDACGANCKPLGNVLIIQEDNYYPDIPDDNVNGGVITFHFDKPLRVTEIGLLDIDEKSFIRVETLDSGKTTTSDITVPMLGDNSVQTVNIDTDNVSQLDVNLTHSGAVIFLSFCYMDLAMIGEICNGGDTCETDYCFNAILPDGTKPAGVCSCNPTTNAGCMEPMECAFSPLIDIGPPDCFLPMGAACSADSNCVSDHCYDGQCVCNEELDFPCNELNACAFQEGSGYLCLSKIGQPCYGGSCETDFCFNAELPGGIIPAGVCSCNPTTNVGCMDPMECAFSPLIDIGPPDCFLPMGAACSADSNCVSDHCYDGLCVCNEELDFPCNEAEACTFQEGYGYFCQAKLVLGIDEECLEDTECESGYCWADWLMEPQQPGICRCNIATDEGCPDGSDCLFPLPPGSAPSCFLPVGATCSNNAECFSSSCHENVCA